MVHLENHKDYDVYLLSNPDLKVAPYFELLVPGNTPNSFEILDQEITTINTTLVDDQVLGMALSSDVPIAELKNPGFFQGKEVENLILHVARQNRDQLLITSRLKVRVNRVPTTTTSLRFNQKKQIADSPFSTGNWYKITIPKRGIYQLNSEYLQEIGINIDSIDPRNIQIWGTNGWVLPELNSAEKPEFTQFPIIVEGESDGSFDSGDRVLFFGNSAHQIERQGSTFTHEIHPYSDVTHVFLTIGTDSGNRLSTTTLSGSSSATISTFTDFIWKEEELNKAEDRQRSGRYWLGQSIPATAQNIPVSIFRDTIPGILPNQDIRTSGRIYSRALRTTSYNVSLNSSSVAQLNISRVSGGYQSYNGDAAVGRTFSSTLTTSIEDDILEMEVIMSNGDDGATGFVDYLRFQAERSLTAENDFLFFLPPENSTPNDITDYQLSGFNNSPIVLDVTDPTNPIRYEVSSNGNDFDFKAPHDDDRQYLAQASLFVPPVGSSVASQNIKGLSNYPDYIIVTSETFKPYADELAQYRINDGLTPLVVTQTEILNEFSGGSTDPTAIRDFLKFLWDRAIIDGEATPKHLLLFGDTTYDTKNIIDNAFTNHVLTYQSPNSLSRIGSYGSDDYFGFMDDNEGGFTVGSRIDIGIGRIPAQNRREARIALDKIYIYENPENAGDWQNMITFAGDDDFPDINLNRDLHVWNADGTADRMNVIDSGLRLNKIYLFDYPEEVTSSGREIPGATADFIKALNSGTLVINYSGHGNTDVLSDEGLFSIDDIPSLTNSDKLSILVTATCQFGRYDNINAQSGAEKLFFAENGGAVASFTTTRIVYTSSNPEGGQNFALNIALSQQILIRDSDGRPATMGEIYMRTKNTSAGSSSNSRRFILLGDPALRIALPSKPVGITEINGIDVTASDTVVTIKALDTVTLKGEVSNLDSTFNANYNGVVSVALLDAKRTVSLPQDLEWIDSRGCFLYRGSSRECTYEIENSTLFKGSANVINGEFEMTFVLPKDISFNPNQARIVVFADGEDGTAGGSFTNVIFNGINENAVNDGTGPELDIYLNDESFFNGDLTTDQPKLIVELADSSGINATGTGVGHEIIATIDTNPMRTVTLNEFYQGALNDFSKGRIEYPLEAIPEGNYSLKVRAWDVHNNPSEESIFFEVAQSEDLVIDDVYNYPNPMNNETSFTFEHNQQGNALDVDIRIYTLSGRPVQHLQEFITNTAGSYASIPWNGRDRDNDRLGNGTYIYVLRVTADTPEGRKSTEKIEKLVIIR